MRKQKTWLHHRSSGLASVREVGRSPNTAARRPKNSGEEECLDSQHEERRPESRTWRHRPSSVRVYPYLNVLAFKPFNRRYAGARLRCCIRTVKEFAVGPEERGAVVSAVTQSECTDMPDGSRSRLTYRTTKYSTTQTVMCSIRQRRKDRPITNASPEITLSPDDAFPRSFLDSHLQRPSSALSSSGLTRWPKASRPRR